MFLDFVKALIKSLIMNSSINLKASHRPSLVSKITKKIGKILFMFKSVYLIYFLSLNNSNPHTSMSPCHYQITIITASVEILLKM